MKYIKSGIVIIVGLLCVGLNITLAGGAVDPLPTKPIAPVTSQTTQTQEQQTKKALCKLKCTTAGNDNNFCECKCNGGIVLNTDFPFIGRCIGKGGNTSNGDSSISAIAQAFTNIFMTLIITGGFAMVIRGGVQITMGQNKEGMKKIQNVVIAFAALGSLGIILRLINPNFFK